MRWEGKWRGIKVKGEPADSFIKGAVHVGSSFVVRRSSPEHSRKAADLPVTTILPAVPVRVCVMFTYFDLPVQTPEQSAAFSFIQ